MSACNARERPGFDPRVGKIPWRRKWQPIPALLPGKSHGRRTLVGYSQWGRKESDTTERPHFHFSFSKCLLGLPWWLSGKESACQCRRCMFNPGSRKIPHATEQLSPRATTTEPVLQSPGAAATQPTCHAYGSPSTLEPVLHSKRSHRYENT